MSAPNAKGDETCGIASFITAEPNGANENAGSIRPFKNNLFSNEKFSRSLFGSGKSSFVTYRAIVGNGGGGG